ncbi:DeoR/GlpR family DNA-binding transcription regulator [Paenibacillus turpanensis]|uniref:DeoR/GlpR family DNA-binding transcription regulator n=1 Tax=Paenibacillus turpanensis TaxID=2689078 RepID=UPI001A9D868D|nr:DeoR/GlpR family DNA-binding transcription regulator [Paenibacillus turpanensis]
MLYEEERKQKIADYVQEHRRASVQELAQHFQVSESTVRRDLKDLEEVGKLRRTHGGAMLLQNDNNEPPFVEKEDRFRAQKEAIACAALSIVQEDETIFLDSGSTTYCLAKLLKNYQKLTVVTNSVMAATELSSSKGIDLVLTGGTLRHETLAMVGPIAEKTLDYIRVDHVFLAINGFDVESGLSTPSLIEAEMKRKMIGAGKQVVLLADHSKYGKVSFAKVAGMEVVDLLITDEGLHEENRKAIESAGIHLITT